jgi:hypothetical protein
MSADEGRAFSLNPRPGKSLDKLEEEVNHKNTKTQTRSELAWWSFRVSVSLWLSSSARKFLALIRSCSSDLVCQICFSLSHSNVKSFLANLRQAKAYRTLSVNLWSNLFFP